VHPDGLEELPAAECLRLSEEVTVPGEITRLGRLGLEAWAPGTRDHFVRVTPSVVTGRRLRPARG
jgi:uncharacterized protein